MSRRVTIKKRPVPADPVYGSRLVTMTSRRIMRSGKKSVANRIIYDAFDIIKEKTATDPMEVFEKAVKNTTPLVEVKARRFDLLHPLVHWQIYSPWTSLRERGNIE